MVSNSRNKIHQTWEQPFRGPLQLHLTAYRCSTVSEHFDIGPINRAQVFSCLERGFKFTLHHPMHMSLFKIRYITSLKGKYLTSPSGNGLSSLEDDILRKQLECNLPSRRFLTQVTGWTKVA